MTTLKRVLASTTPFSYACAGCGRCCHDKRITLTPYEIARLARATGMSTREILDGHTDEAGTVLRFEGGVGPCTFLREGRCTAHGGRPLACRLYPLGRIVQGGTETFVEVEGHPESAGIYGDQGTPAGWAEAQGATPFIAWASRYHAIFRRMAEVLTSRADASEAWSEALTPATPVPDEWLDVDAVIARSCTERGEPEPDRSDVEARMEIHAAALERWVEAFGRSSDG